MLHQLRLRLKRLNSQQMAYAIKHPLANQLSQMPRIIGLLLIIMFSFGANNHLILAQTGGQTDILTGIWPRALAFDGKNVWIANGFDNTVLRIDESTGKSIDKAPIPVGAMPSAMAWDSDLNLMWVAGYNDQSLTIIKPDGTIAKKLTLKDGTTLTGHPISMAYLLGTMWVVGQNNDIDGEDGVWAFKTSDFTFTKAPVGNFPTAIAVTQGTKPPLYIWVTNGNDDTISMIDFTKPDKVLKTFSANIPAFPVSITFDGASLWVGNYEGKIVKLDALSGQVQELKGIDVKGRPVGVLYNGGTSGHTWIINGHGKGIMDVNSQNGQPNGQSPLTILSKFQDTTTSYAGAALVTSKYVYVADWLNDRVTRFTVPTAIAVVPTAVPSATPTISPFTVTPAVTIPACNEPPIFNKGDKGVVKVDKFKVDLKVHKTPVLSKDTETGELIKVGSGFTVNDGPVIDTANKNVCFYNVTTTDGKISGWVVQGGAGEDPIRYYVDVAK